MATPAAAPGEPTLGRTLAPLPLTRRGYGIPLNQHPKEAKWIYTNGRVVVIRDLENPANSLVFTEHKCAVNVAVFSPSGYWVASGDCEGNVIIWSYPQMKVKYQYQILKSINDLDWDESSTRIVAAGDGAQKARVFSWDSGNNLGEITMHSQPILSVSYRKVRPFRIVSGSEDLSVNIYEGPPFKYANSYKGHARYPNAVKYSPDGSKYASVGADSKIVIFEGAKGDVIKELEQKDQGHKGAIYSYVWSPDSTQLLTVSADKTAKIWNIESGNVTNTFTFGNDTFDQQVGALWHQSYALTVSLSGAINYLDIASSSIKRVLHGHQCSIQSLAIDAANNKFYTAGLTGEIAEWDNATGTAKWLKGKGHGGKVVSAIVVQKGGKILSSFGMDDKVRLNDLSKGELNSDASELGGLPVAAVASPTDASLSAAVLAQDKVVLLRNGSVAYTHALGFTPTAVGWSPNGQLWVGGKPKKLAVLEVAGDTLKHVKDITTHEKPLTSIRFSPDGRLVASTDMEASVFIHTTDSSNAVQNKSGWRFHQAVVKDCDWNSTGTRLVTSSLDCHLIVWKDFSEFNGSERVRVKDAHADGANIVRFWDDRTIVSIGADKTIKFWNLTE